MYIDYIYHFNMLDRNMAYCLRHYHRKSKDALLFENFLKMPFGKKVKKILKLVKESDSVNEFIQFADLAEECRNLRNVVVNGEWEWDWKGFLNPPIFYHAPEPFNKKGNITVEGFSGSLEVLNKIANTFMKSVQLLKAISRISRVRVVDFVKLLITKLFYL